MRFLSQAILLTAVCLVSLMPVQAAPSQGAISGTVYSDSGTAIAGASVEAFSCIDLEPFDATRTAADGRYRFATIDDGCYHLRFHRAGYESTWLDNHPLSLQSKRIVVAGAEVADVDAPLSEAGAILGGRVMDSAGAPLEGAWVVGYGKRGDHVSLVDARTDASGSFSIDASPGEYILIATSDGYVTQFLGGLPDKPVYIEAVSGEVSADVEFLLEKGGSVSGRVVDAAGNGLQGIYVVIQFDDRFPAAALTRATGSYTLGGVPTGEHAVIFADAEQRYQISWYNGGKLPKEATPVKVKAPENVLGIDAVLSPAGAISGWMTDADGNGVPGILLVATGVEATGGGGSALSDEDGAYTIQGLGTGRYLVLYQQEGRFLDYNFYPGTKDREAALPVAVQAPLTTSGINLSLPGNNGLTGRILNPEGEPLAMVGVSAHKVGDDSWRPAGYAASDEQGYYLVPLGPGEYVVQFHASNGYLSQWTGGSATREEAEPLVIGEGKAVTLDMVLPLGGAISGTVRNQIGEGVAGVELEARDATADRWAGVAVSEEDGTYRLDGLRSGEFRLVADGTKVGYVKKSVPMPVKVAMPEVTEKVDLVVVPGGSIAGTVTGPDGKPQEEVEVQVVDPTTWMKAAQVDTGPDGTYRVSGLPQGQFAVHFEKKDFVVQWARGKSRREEAELITITGTAAITGVNAVLSRGASLTGLVTAAGGAPLSGVEVEVFGDVEDEPFATVRSGRDGRYTIPNLAPGSYRVRFGHLRHRPQWHGGVHRAEADAITIADSGTTNLSMQLSPVSGRVAGKMISPGGDDVGQAWMTVLDAISGAEVADERICECSGKFNIPLNPGVYILRVERNGRVYWYGGTQQKNAEILSINGEVSGLEMVIPN